MAQATINTTTIETPVLGSCSRVKKEEKQTGVRLDLTMAEAEVMLRITGFIGGSSHSPRTYVTRIREALLNAGVVQDNEHYVTDGKSVYFKDYPSTKKAPEVAPQVPRKINSGDQVKVLRDRSAIKAGEMAEVTGDLAGGVFLKTADGRTGYDHFDYLELVTEAPRPAVYLERFVDQPLPEAAPSLILGTSPDTVIVDELAPATPLRNVQYGDRAKLTKVVDSFRAGETVEVSRIGCGGLVYFESVGCGPKRTGHTAQGNLELITA